MMPEVDGQALIAHMTTEKHRVPVIVCTAALPRVTPKFDPEIIRAVVRKPFDIEHLMTTVSELVESTDQTLPSWQKSCRSREFFATGSKPMTSPATHRSRLPAE